MARKLANQNVVWLYDTDLVKVCNDLNYLLARDEPIKEITLMD